MTTPMWEDTRPDRHGIAVFVRHWPHDRPRAVVTVAHGASEHSGRYARFAEALQAAGFAVFAVDHRGHGHTAASTGAGRLGEPGAIALIDDLDELVDDAQVAYPGVPVVAFGHSMGSLLTLVYATHHPQRLAAVVLCGFPAPSAGLDDLAGMFQTAVEAGMADEPIDLLAAANQAFEPARTPFDWLSRDETEVDRYLADPMCGDDNPLTYGFVAGMFELLTAAVKPSALDAIRCPVLLVTGDQDPAAELGSNATALADLLDRSGVTVTNRLYEGARHELLNELNRDEVTRDVIEWIGSQLPG
jgi:alpha-beta hydrolase superfamily lysophospholipase